ncbi:hypothetical protein B0H13DRAFT_2133341, partial [Mycena leptocephala]
EDRRRWQCYVSSLLFLFPDVGAALFGLFFSVYSQHPRPSRSQRRRARYHISCLYPARSPPSPFRPPAPPPPHRSRPRAEACEHQVRG